MRRVLQALIISGMLVPAAACGTAAPAPGEPGAGIGSAAAAPPPATAAAGSVQSTCEALGQAYGRHMAPVAQALTELADARKRPGADSEYQAEVKESLTAFATAIRGATQDSTDPTLRADGKKAADQVRAKAADAKVFSTVKTPADVNEALGTTLKGWLAPVDQHCS